MSNFAPAIFFNFPKFLRWRTHAYEITHEIKNRKEDAFKREQKLIDELNAKSNAMKDQTRIILQHENSIRHMNSENETLKAANSSLNERVSEVRKQVCFCMSKGSFKHSVNIG